MRVELLVLLNVRLLNFFLLLLVGEDELLVLHVEFLFLEFGDAVLGQLGLHVATLFFAGDSVLLHRRATQIKGMGESRKFLQTAKRKSKVKISEVFKTISEDARPTRRNPDRFLRVSKPIRIVRPYI